MKNKTKSKKNSKVAVVSNQGGPGRPKYEPVYPKANNWTFQKWMEVNGIETDPNKPNFGKGPKCTMLTLRKNMERDMYYHKQGKPCIAANRTHANPRSKMVLVPGVTAEPNSESGLGRRANLYALREKVSASKGSNSNSDAPKSKKSAKSVSSASQTPTADALDKIHVALATPEPATAITVPAVTITAPEAVPATSEPVVAPEAPVATPEAAMAASEAPVAETANVETTPTVSEPVIS